MLTAVLQLSSMFDVYAMLVLRYVVQQYTVSVSKADLHLLVCFRAHMYVRVSI